MAARRKTKKVPPKKAPPKGMPDRAMPPAGMPPKGMPPEAAQPATPAVPAQGGFAERMAALRAAMLKKKGK